MDAGQAERTAAHTRRWQVILGVGPVSIVQSFAAVLSGGTVST